MSLEHGFLHQGLQLRYLVLLLILTFSSSSISADTRPNEALTLYSLAGNWQRSPGNWKGKDPCGSTWVGINCSNSHITHIFLSGLAITGTLSEDIQNLPELVYLDLSFNPSLGGQIPRTIGNLVKLKRLILVGCSFSGFIPPELGKLSRLEFLSLNSNQLSGPIPGELGNLSSLGWFDLTNNQISGSIPVSSGTNIGLDMLTKCKHFHFGKNNLSGSIPPELFHSEMILLHVLFDSNKLTGRIPQTLGLVNTLQALRLDRNLLTGPVPSNLNNLTNLTELQLSNNQLSGPLPDLTRMNALAYVDMSNNSFDQSDIPPWFSTLPSLTTLMLEYLKVAGELPASLFGSHPLQKARLRTNLFNGTLDLGSQYSRQLTLVDVQGNRIQNLYDGGYPQDLRLEDNPYCNQQGAVSKYCNVPQQTNPPPYSTPTQTCINTVCPSDQEMSPLCSCSYPYEGTLVFRFLTFSNTENFTYYQILEKALYKTFQNNQVPVGSLLLHNPDINVYNYFQVDLWIFHAAKNHFDESEVVLLTKLFSNLTFSSPDGYGPYYFITKPYPKFSDSKSKRVGLIVGGTVGGFALASLIICLVLFTLWRRRNAMKAKLLSQTSGSWNPSQSSSGVPQLKGSRLFSFEELKKCTNNFSEENAIGSGSYGKVYRGALVDGQLIAVKRAQQGSMQGHLEFKTEIEMLSRVHHRNLVSLVGFCFDQNEQILVYEFVPNGSLRESLTGKSGVQLDWKKRLRIALDAARGLTYLHELANPRIIHRDVKSNNILLDHNLNAKVSDFGLCKPMGEDRKGYITTQVKGTMGYLDPEYYMTQHLTEKSDVYSFGVLMLELVTARKPIERGRFIVREVRNAMSNTKDLLGLQELLDPSIGLNNTLPGFKRFIELAMRCVEESSADRPWMSEVVKEIENIMVLAGMNPYIASESNSASFWEASKSHPYHSDASFDYSGGTYSPRVEPK